MMLYRVKPEEFGQLLALFGAETIPFYVQGILSGKYEGGVWVDDLEKPTAVLVLHKAWAHLLGLPSEGFLNKLRTMLQSEEPLGEKRSVIFFVEPTAVWLVGLQTAVPHRQLIPSPRRLYRAVDPLVKQQTVPAEFTLHPIDSALSPLLEDELPDDVTRVLSLRERKARPDEMAFGFVAIHERRCVAWAVVDFIVADEGEIRLVTEGAFRRRGLAAAVSAATIEAGLVGGLTAVWWDVAETNRASIALAEKLGLRLHSRPLEHILIYPEVGYFINYAWHFLDQQQFGETIEVAEQMVQKEAEMLQQYGHFLLGAAHAGLEEDEAAWRHLRQAVALGFDDVGEMMGCPPLKRLQGSAEWATLLPKQGE